MFNYNQYYKNYPYSMYNNNDNYNNYKNYYTASTNNINNSCNKFKEKLKIDSNDNNKSENTQNVNSKIQPRSEKENGFRIGPLTVSNDKIDILGFSFEIDDLIIIGLMLIIFLDSDSDFVLLIILGLMLFNISFSSLNLF